MIEKTKTSPENPEQKRQISGYVILLFLPVSFILGFIFFPDHPTMYTRVGLHCMIALITLPFFYYWYFNRVDQPARAAYAAIAGMFFRFLGAAGLVVYIFVADLSDPAPLVWQFGIAIGTFLIFEIASVQAFRLSGSESPRQYDT